MTSRDFVYWLQGYFEISNPHVIEQKEIEVIKNHLNLVFKHEIDVESNSKLTGDQINNLNKIHVGAKNPKDDFDPHTTVLRC